MRRRKSIKITTDNEISTLRVLKWPEVIRARPAMYIGDTGMLGLHHLVWECINNAVIEEPTRPDSKIDCLIDQDGSITISDDGPGIPFLDNTLIYLLTTSYAPGPKYRLETVNALSEWMSVEVHRDGLCGRMSFVRGEVTKPFHTFPANQPTGTKLHFKPDPSIFGTVTFDFDFICRRFQELSFLIPGLTLQITDHRSDSHATYTYTTGLAACVQQMNESCMPLFPEVITHEAEFEGAKITLAFQPTSGFDTKVTSFVNAAACQEGTHIIGFRAGLTQALFDYAKRHGLLLHAVPKFNHYSEGMTAAIALWLETPYFEGPTRFKLGNVEVASTVRDVVCQAVETWAERRPDLIHQMVEKAVCAAERDAG